MKKSEATIRVRLVPMTDEDKQALREAISLISALSQVFLRHDWEGHETYRGLQRIYERLEDYAVSYEIPIPISRRGTGPLFTRDTEAE